MKCFEAAQTAAGIRNEVDPLYRWQTRVRSPSSVFGPLTEVAGFSFE